MSTLRDPKEIWEYRLAASGAPSDEIDIPGFGFRGIAGMIFVFLDMWYFENHLYSWIGLFCMLSAIATLRTRDESKSLVLSLVWVLCCC
jgi:hypothetical protein